MKSYKNHKSLRLDPDIRLTEQDIKAMKCRDISMTTEEYLEFLKDVHRIPVPTTPRSGPKGKKFELP